MFSWSSHRRPAIYAYVLYCDFRLFKGFNVYHKYARLGEANLSRLRFLDVFSRNIHIKPSYSRFHKIIGQKIPLHRIERKYTMGAHPSRNVTLSPRSEDPETVYLRNKVMEYLQTFDQSHSSQGRRNRALGVIDVQSLQESNRHWEKHLLINKPSMREKYSLK